jgi:hypothetical protein
MTMQPLKAHKATSAKRHTAGKNAASKPTRARQSARGEPPARFGALRGITTIVDATDDLLSAGDGWSVE